MDHQFTMVVTRTDGVVDRVPGSDREQAEVSAAMLRESPAIESVDFEEQPAVTQ